MRRPSHRTPLPAIARAVAVLAGLLVLAATGCGKPAAPPAQVATDPSARLSQLLRQGGRPGQLTKAEREEVERLLPRVLPTLTGPLAGYQWRVAYDDLPGVDLVSVDLMEGAGEKAPRAMWFLLFWRGPMPAAEQAAWPLRLGRWPARGLEGHHLFVRVGGVELRAVADAAEYRDAQRIRGVLAGFDLDGLSRL